MSNEPPSDHAEPDDIESRSEADGGAPEGETRATWSPLGKLRERRARRLPRSLRRATRRALRQLGKGSSPQDGEDRTRARWRGLFGRWALVWPLTISFGGVWFSRSDFGVAELVTTPDGGSKFLSGIWQVEAVALALSVAVIIFGLQAFFASRHSRTPDSLPDFAADSGLFFVLGVGIAGLLLPAFVLAGYGSGAPGGWAATWASGFCALGLLLISFAFLATVRSVDPRRLNERRNRRIKTESPH